MVSGMDFDLVIVGGGLAGAALAVALRRSSLRIAVVEASPPVRSESWDQRVYAYSPASARFLDELGAWRHIDPARLQPVSEMRVFGDDGGAICFSAYESGLSELAWIGESSRVHLELWESLRRQHNVTLFCPARPQALEIRPTGVALRVDDGRTLSASLIVGADGRDSWCVRRPRSRRACRPMMSGPWWQTSSVRSRIGALRINGSGMTASWPGYHWRAIGCPWSGRPPTRWPMT